MTSVLHFFSYRYKELLLALIIAGTAISLGLQSINFAEAIQIFSSAKNITTSAVTATEKNTLTNNDFLPVFGIAGNKKAVKQFIPATSLNLKLKGILSNADDNTLSSAIIQDASGTEKLYKQGDKLPGGAVLESVESNAVIIRYLGNLQKIFFPEESTSPSLTSAEQFKQSQEQQYSQILSDRNAKMNRLARNLT